MESATAPSDDAAPAGDAQSPVDVLRAYYRSIDARNYAAAYDAWGSSGPPDQTLDQFARGFSDTARVDVTTGTPSRVEPAAGSRYVQVPVTVTATTKSGATQRFTGTYTLRRSVVDGATEAQRKWHIYRASIERAD